MSLMVAPHSTMDKFDSTIQQLYTGKELTRLYVKFRPTFPEEIYETIVHFSKESGTGNELAVDVGCGPGLSSLPLANYYKQVIGVDVSQSQISNAPTNLPGLSFRVAPAEDISFIQSGSVDIVTACVALYWFQLDRFYQELDRILKPNGCFAAYSHSMFLMEDNTEINNYINHIIFEVLGQYWTSRWRVAVVDQYKTLNSPYKDNTRFEFVMKKYWTLDQLLGFIDSTSAVEKYKEANPTKDLIEEMRERLFEMCGLNENNIKVEKFKFQAPVFMIMARKPGNLA